MTDRATLQALLNRVLEGTGPDRELDGEIHAATLYIKPITPEAIVTRECQENGFYAFHHVPVIPGGVSYWHQAPHYTASLDAALTLVPEGWSWELYSEGAALLWKQPPEPAIRYTITAPRCATPPRALIAACLKAKMEDQGE